MNSKNSNLPLVLGVVGHLDIIVDNLLIQDITKKLCGIIESISDDVPIIMQSQLAVGTDTLVALIFLSLKDKYPNKSLKLQAPLPMSKEEYIKDFQGEDLDTFNYLCSQADEVFELPTDFSTDRDEWYNQGANYITDSSMLVMIFWDGFFNNKKGGTSESVKRIHFGSNYRDVFADNENKAIIWHVKRKSNKRVDESNIDIINHYSYERTMLNSDNINIFKFLNKSSNLATKVTDEEIVLSENYLSKDNFKQALENPNLISLINFYALNDAISIKEQKKYLFVSKLVFSVSFFAMLIFQFYEKLQFSAIFQIIFPCTVIALMIYLKKSNISIGNNTSFLRHRLIAESLRINFYTSSAGLPIVNQKNSVVIHHDNWLNRVAHSLAKIAIRKEQIQIKNAHEVITKNWLTSQYDYFKNKSSQLTKKINVFKRLINIIFGLVLTIFFLSLAANFTNSPYFDILINIDFTLFISFLILKTYYDFREYENTLLQSQTMLNIYTKHINHLNLESSDVETIYAALADKSLTELHLWYLIYKSKQPGIEV